MDNEVSHIVRTNYEGFANSVQGFSSIFQEFTEAQYKVKNLKDYVLRSKDALVNRKRNLKSLWFEKIQKVRVLEILAEMEEIRSCPRQ